MRNGCVFGHMRALFGAAEACAHVDQYDRDDRSTWPKWLLAPAGHKEANRHA